MSNGIASERLIEYLKIKTVHPEPDYGKIYSNNIKTKFFIL